MFEVCIGSYFPFIHRISCVCLFQENYMIFWTSDNFTFITNLLFYFSQTVTDLLMRKEAFLESQTTTLWNRQLCLGLILNKTSLFVS